MWGLIFPGQGSQYVGMGKFLWEQFPSSKRLFEQASDLLSLDFKKLCFNSSESELALTEKTQPTLLLVSTCLNQALKENTAYPIQMAAGHSVGEYGALVASEALTFEMALKAIKVRAQSMQEAVPVGQGGMLAVMGLETNAITELCQWATQESRCSPLEPANFNAPGQVVISGQQKAIDFLVSSFKPEVLSQPPRRFKFIPLKVSAPFHCSMMAPAQEQMQRVLSETPFASPSFPVVQNVSAIAETNPETLRINLVQQVTHAVRWVECVNTLSHQGIQTLIEAGPGTVLKGLVKKIAPDLKVFNINSIDEFKEVENALSPQ